MIKLIVGVIVAIFWAIGGIASAVKKKSDEAQKRTRARLPSGAAAPVPAPASYPAPKRVRSQQKKLAPVQQTFAAPPPAPPRPPVTAQPAQTAPAAKVNASAPVPPDQIARLLRRPETLRAAMILNEVMAPPKALRE
jgi:hypothetical protein